jgi:hypothetical protein
MKTRFFLIPLMLAAPLLLTAPMIASFPANAQNLPPGSYLGSCNNCKFDGRYLNCHCSTGNHNFVSNVDWQDTSIEIARCDSGSAANINGNLRCE